MACRVSNQELCILAQDATQHMEANGEQKKQTNQKRNSCKWTGIHLQQESYAQRAQTSADLEDPDFGLWTPGSEA